MKTNTIYLLVIAGTGVVLACLAGPTIIVTPPALPTVVVSPPSPPAVTVAVVPDTYVWDGTEYVGMVGNQYYYLGPGNVWMVMDPVRLNRFHGWQTAHADWRDHAIHNVKYRNYNHNQPQPMHEDNLPAHNDHPDTDHDHNGPPQ
jgi:hypothetical protein